MDIRELLTEHTFHSLFWAFFFLLFWDFWIFVQKLKQQVGNFELKSANIHYVLKILFSLINWSKNLFTEGGEEHQLEFEVKILTPFWFKLVHSTSKDKAGLIFQLFVTATSLFVTNWHFDKKRTRSITSVYTVVILAVFVTNFITITTDCFLSWSNKQVN